VQSFLESFLGSVAGPIERSLDCELIAGRLNGSTANDCGSFFLVSEPSSAQGGPGLNEPAGRTEADFGQVIRGDLWVACGLSAGNHPFSPWIFPEFRLHFCPLLRDCIENQRVQL